MRYFCQDHGDVLRLETRVEELRDGRVCLAEHPFYPGGGGQLPDRGRLLWDEGAAQVAGFREAGGRLWLELDSPVPVGAPVTAEVDAAFRDLQAQLHTDLHIVNALVYRHFDGALVTGAQMNADGTARVDFDVPAADSAALRALEPEINAVIAADMPVRCSRIPYAEAAAEPGLLRSQSVAPPPDPDGTIRVVEIVGLDRQACGGTHLTSTGGSAPVRIAKVDNKGRKNRRIRIALVEQAGAGA